LPGLADNVNGRQAGVTVFAILGVAAKMERRRIEEGSAMMMTKRRFSRITGMLARTTSP
jgi:hypothetical protein